MKSRLLSFLLLFAIAGFGQTASRWEYGIHRGKLVQFRVVDGLAIYQGDIILGTAEELKKALAASEEGAKSNGRKQSLIVSEPTAYWPNATIPYVIDPAITDSSNILAAIQHWQDKTPIKFVPRSAEANWVTFKLSSDNSVCSSSSLGRKGGEQFILGSPLCPVGALIHEIGHAVGLEHEQGRSDASDHVRILFENISTSAYNQFAAFSDQPYDVGDYDYGSIMHYAATDFSKNGQLALETIPPGIPIGQTTSLSAGDIDAVGQLYNTVKDTTIATNPPGLQVIVDGQSVQTPATYGWTIGSVHTLEVQGGQKDADARYEFGRWSNDGDRKHSVQIGRFTTLVTAHFIRFVRIQPQISPEGAGTITIAPPSEDGYYREGSLISGTISANPGFYLTSVTSPFLERNGLTNLAVEGLKGVVDERRQGLKINFSAVAPVTFKSNSGFTALLIDGKRYFTPASFQWEPGSAHTVEADASFPEDGGAILHVFDKWSDGGERAHSVMAGAEGATYTVNFRKKYLVRVIAFPTGAGTVTLKPDSADGYYEDNSTVEVAGVPATGYKFAAYLFDLTGSAISQTFTVDRYTVAAGVFARPGTIPVIVNAATMQQGYLVPGGAVSVFSPEFGPAQAADAAPGADGKLASLLAGTRVLMSGIAAPVLSTARNQATAVAPYQVPLNVSQSAVLLEYNGGRTSAVGSYTDLYDPGIYTVNGAGRGQAVVFNEDGSQNSADNPAEKGSVVTILATGLGTTTPDLVDAKIGTLPLPEVDGFVEVRIGGRQAEVGFAGGVEGKVAGISQVKARVPADSTPGAAVTLVLRVENYGDQYEATMAVK